jgi:hypothetical protein
MKQYRGGIQQWNSKGGKQTVLECISRQTVPDAVLDHAKNNDC